MSADPQTVSPSAVIARQDRIQVWSLPYLYVFIIGLGFLFTFFDIFDINVSFIQTCTQIVKGCLAGPPPGLTALPPGTVAASSLLGAPVLWNLIGYVIGALILSPLADRFGRRDMLLVTLIITGIGSLFTAFVGDYNTFIVARTITGIGIGADLAIVNTYINEVAPRGGRAKFTSLIFINSALGAFLGIWLGLILTTPASPFPTGLSFAQAVVDPKTGVFMGNGWRIMYIVGAALALIGIALRVQLPESPRWLVSRGRVQEADQVVRRMESRASKSAGIQLPQAMDEVPVQAEAGKTAFAEIFSNPTYLRRVILLLVMWLFAYVTVYSIAAGLTTVLASLGYIPPEAGMIAAVGTFGFIACALFAYFFGERLERKYWLPIGAVLTLIGGVLIAVAGKAPAIGPQGPQVTGPVILAFVGAIILFFGFNIWVPITYAWSTENFPTRARTTGFGIVDGIGHVGGGVGLVVIANSVLPNLGSQQNGVLYAFLLIGAFLVVAAIIAQFGISTRGKRLDVIAP